MRWLAAIGLTLVLAALTYGQTASSTPRLRRWSDSSFPIPWRLNFTRGQNIEGAREIGDVIRTAFQRWSSIGTALVSFQEKEASTVTDPGFDSFNQISVVPASYTSGALALTLTYSFSSPGAVDEFQRRIEFPGQILEADIVFNPQTLYSTDLATPTGRIDLESVAVHEIGHLLGLDHTAISSSTMFPTITSRVNYGRVPSADDGIAVSKLYPAPGFYTSRGGTTGVVRTSAGATVFGAHVVALDADGRPVTSVFTDPNGIYRFLGLEPGLHTIYVEPVDGPVQTGSIARFNDHFSGNTPATNFSTRFGSSASIPAMSLSKTTGDTQTGDMGEALTTLLEVSVTDGGGAPMQGVTVNFMGTSGGAAVVPFTGQTDSAGKIRATAYLGTGLTQTVTAYAGAAASTFTATVRAPVLSSLTAASGARGASVNLTITGKNFAKNSTNVTVSGTGVTVTGVTVNQSTLLTATFNIAANADATVRTVTVSGPNGASGTLNFTVQ